MKTTNGSKNLKTKILPKTIVYTGDSELDTRIRHYRYDADSFEMLDRIKIPDIEKRDMIVVEGFKNKEMILNLTNKFGINEFFVEDIFNVSQRNKCETTNDQMFIVLKYAYVKDGVLDFRWLYFILKKELVILFSDYDNDYVEELLSRINNNNAIFTSYDESYIIYTIYDMIIDEQLELARVYREELDTLEIVILQSNKTLSQNLYKLHKNLVQLRNNIRSISDYVSPKDINQNDLVHADLNPFILDLDDHIHNLNEKLNTNIDVCNSLITMYSTQISNRTNDVMKILTIISVIFIPLSFLAGVFGMNFVKFDILQNQYGLLIFIVVSLLISTSMLLWFRLRKWI